ncbi:protein Wnt-11b-2-like [Babylonia areolata]|uniref:protein Wnt-11b-2-like n=1 Tax=Babylonia areolata TaxID=304850 RepID=UPI003FD5B7F6
MRPWMLVDGFVVFLSLLMLLWCVERSSSVKWLALHRGKLRSWTHGKNCSRRTGLVKQQVRQCRHNLDLMPSVVRAALVAVETCQRQFADRRWNCSSVLVLPGRPKDLLRGTREKAYVYSISAAALVHSVARACSIGVTTKCSCGRLPTSPPGADFKWGGCGDDLTFGTYFSHQFTEASLMKLPPVSSSLSSSRTPASLSSLSSSLSSSSLFVRGLGASRQRKAKRKGRASSSTKVMMDKHNFAAGRSVVQQSLVTACKCHGVSGSCSIKTCWKALPDFDLIGAALKMRYALAVEVKRRKRKKQYVLIPIQPGKDSFAEDELIYYAKSPDYCSPDPKTGSVGTRGRLCDPNTDGPGHCRPMCCGRGADNFTLEITERCECKYHWCCYVKCKTCRRTLHLSKCR